MTTTAKPLLFLAFANDRDDRARYLRNLAEEARQVQRALAAAEARGHCELVLRQNATAGDILDVFQDARTRGRIALFHFGGHADGYRLLLETAAGQPAAADAGGLACFLAQQHGLTLVFLNGCSTAGQVSDLLDAGVQAVIATDQAVEDGMATAFAARFYRGLAGGAAIGAAFEEAKAAMQMQGGRVFRHLGAAEEADGDRIPWRLHTRAGAEPVAGWSLPLAAADPLFGLPELPPLDLPDKPYRYLDWYRREDAGILFGRGREIRQLYDRVTAPDGPPIVLLYGQSGVGKSSLLAAGLLPRLEAGLVPRLEAGHAVRYARRDQALGMAGTLAAALGTGPDADPAAAWRDLEAETGRPLLVILDQVEELYTRPNRGQPDEMAAFLAAATALFGDPGLRPAGRLILSFRKEWLAEITARLAESDLPRAEVFLERLDRAGIVEVVAGPRRTARLRSQYGLEIGDPLLPGQIADDLLADRESPVAPMLAILLADLWDAARARNYARPTFDADLYHELRARGLKLDDFLGRQLGALHGKLPEAVDSGLALDLLAHHTTPLGTAEQRTLAELEQTYGHRQDVLPALVQECRDLYLLVDPSRNQPGQAPASRLTHDTLAPHVRKRSDESDQPGQRARRILESRAVEWQEGEQGAALDEVDLRAVEAGLVGMRDATAPEQRLISASRISRDRRRHNRRLLRVGTVIALIAIVLSAGFAFLQWRNAEREAAYNLAQSLISQALAINDSELRLLLSVEATRATYDRGYQSSAKVAGELQRAIMDGPRQASEVASSWATGVRGITLDPKQRWIALQRGANLGTGRLLSLSDLQPAPLPPGVDNVNEFYFSPKGTLIAAIREKTVIMMDATTLEIQCEMPHSDYVNDAVFSPSEELIFIATYGDASYLWNVSGCQKAGTIAVQLDSGDELDARFTESYPRLILFGRNRTEIWDISDPSLPVRILNENTAWVDVNDDATRLAIRRGNGQVTVLDVTDGSVLCEASDEALVFLSRDGKYAAVRQPWRAQINLWDIENCTLVREIQLREGAVRGVHWLATKEDLQLLVRGNQWVTLFDARTGEMTASLPSFDTQNIRQLHADPFGRFLLLALDDGSVRLWNVKKNLFEQTLRHQIGSFDSMSFFPDGASVATLDGTNLRIWDLPRDGAIAGLVTTRNTLLMHIASDGAPMHLDDIQTGDTLLESALQYESILAISPNHQWLATDGCDETRRECQIRVWDLNTIKPTLKNTSQGVGLICSGCTSSALSSNGRWLVLGGAQKSALQDGVPNNDVISGPAEFVTVWDIQNDRLLDLPISGSDVVTMALSPVEGTLATMDWYGIIKLWSLGDSFASPIELPIGKTVMVWDLDRIEFSPDGSRLLATAWGQDSEGGTEIGSLRVYDVQHHSLLREHNPGSIDLLPGVVHFEFAPDGKSVFVVTQGDIGSTNVSKDFRPGQQIERWEVDTLKRIGKTMTAHDGTVDALALYQSNIALLLASAGSDGIARLWNADTGELLLSLPHDSKIKSVEFSPDGREIVTVDTAGVLHRWFLDPDAPADVRPLIARACNILSRNQLTKGEWLKYLGEAKAHRPTCP